MWGLVMINNYNEPRVRHVKSHREESTTNSGSVIISLRSVHWLEALSCFILTLGYPFLYWMYYSLKSHKKTGIRILFGFFGVIFTIIFGVYGIEQVLTWLGVNIPDAFLGKLAILFILTFALNSLFYVFVFIFDLHNLFHIVFQRAGRDSVSEWLEDIMGHKLWAGENTYRLLEHITKESKFLGRAKWLLVAFLSADIDRKIQPDPDNKGDAYGRIQKVHESTNPAYKITVHGWSVRTYSKFLADNMTHAKQSINWVVDPVDLLTEIIPAHVIEVIVSLGSIVDKHVMSRIQDARKAIDAYPRTAQWGGLIGPYSEMCPRPEVRPNDADPNSCEGLHNECPESFPFKGEPIHRQFDYLWYAIYACTLRTIRNAVKVGGSIKLESGTRIHWADILANYNKRESLVGSLVLPHVDEFRNASCSKKRHIYLGGKPDRLDDANKRVEKGVENIKKYIIKNNHYVKSIVPQLESPSSDNGLFSSLLFYDSSPDGKINCKKPADKDDLWASVTNKEVLDVLLEWALLLFKHTSGGKIKGVFVKDAVKYLVYKNCHDIGFYDDHLVVFSSGGKERDITWSVYHKKPIYIDDYFPPKKDKALEVDYSEIISIIKGTLL